ncbi:MAG: PD-(D/E)XK nuclease family protein, partial [bacterium]
RFKNINIAVPDIEKYKTYIKKVFNRYKIPYFIDSSLNLVDHPLSKFVLDGMECLRTNFQRESVFSYLNNYFSGLEQEEYNNFENIVLKYNIYGNKFFENIKDFLSTFNDIEQKDIDSFIKVVEEKLMPLYRMGSGTDTQQPLKFYIQNINEFLEQMEYRKYIEKLIEEYRADNDFINEKLSAQILDKFTQALEDLNVILGENVFNLTDFISILETVLNSITVSVIPVDLDSVFVGDIKNNNFEVCSAMFILGAVEGVVPQQYTDSALFMDEEINQLNTKDKISPTMDELNARSKFNLFQLMFISNKFLTFSYPTIYESEINTNLSLIIDNLRKIFILSDNKNLPKIKFSDLFVNKETNIDLTALYYNNNEVGLNRYINSIRNIEDNNELKNLESVSALEKILIESYGQERINYYKKLLDYKKEYPKIKNAKDLFFPKNTISASQLKSYFQCPFQHFIQYGLRLQEKEVADLKPKDVGNILHEVANEFGLYLKSNNKRYLSEESLERVQEYIIQKIFNKDKYQYILNDITFRRITKNLKIEARDLIAAINYQLKYMDFTIDKTEYSLDKENIENIYFEIGNDEKVWLKGYIDRIDVSDKYYTIIDYKSGNVEFNFDKIYTGLNLQLLLYAKAVDKAVDKKLAGFFYLPIKQDYDDKQEVALNYKGYKFLGGFLKKLDAIYSLDNRLKQEDYLKSDIIRFTYKKNADKTDKTIDKDFNKRETGAILGEEQMKNLQNYAWKVSQKAIKEMEDGNIDARPVMQSGKISCDFCKFNSICMYYDKLQDNSRDFTNAVDDEQKEKVKSIITDQSWED